MSRTSWIIFTGLWLAVSVNGFHVQQKIQPYSIFLDAKLSGEVILDPLLNHKVKFTFDDDGFYAKAKVFTANNMKDDVLGELASQNERYYSNFSQDDLGFIVNPGDFGLELSFWPTVSVVRPTDPSFHLNDTPVQWKLLLVFSESNRVVYLSSYALKAYLEFEDKGNQSLVVASDSKDTEWYWLNRCHCKWTSSNLEPSEILMMHFEDLCTTVHFNNEECDPPGPIDSPRRHPPSVLPYLIFYIIKLLLIILVIGIVVAIVARLRRQRKERMRVLPRVSYVYSNSNPSQAHAEIIPTSVPNEEKNVSELVFH